MLSRLIISWKQTVHATEVLKNKKGQTIFCSYALQTNFIMKENSMSPNQTAPSSGSILFTPKSISSREMERAEDNCYG